MAAAFSMTMLMSTVAGDAYTYRELDEITAQPVPRSPHTVVIGIAA